MHCSWSNYLVLDYTSLRQSGRNSMSYIRKQETGLSPRPCLGTALVKDISIAELSSHLKELQTGLLHRKWQTSGQKQLSYDPNDRRRCPAKPNVGIKPGAPGFWSDIIQQDPYLMLLQLMQVSPRSSKPTTQIAHVKVSAPWQKGWLAAKCSTPCWVKSQQN